MLTHITKNLECNDTVCHRLSNQFTIVHKIRFPVVQRLKILQRRFNIVGGVSGGGEKKKFTTLVLMKSKRVPR